MVNSWVITEARSVNCLKSIHHFVAKEHWRIRYSHISSLVSNFVVMATWSFPLPTICSNKQKWSSLYATLNILAIYLFIWQGRSGFHCPIKSDRPGAREIKHHVTANGKDDHVNNFSRHFLSSPFAVFHEKRLVFTFTKSVSKNWSLLPLSDTLGIIFANVSLFQSCSTL